MLPYQQVSLHDPIRPLFRLIDGPSVRQGRLQAKFRDRWRSVCTMLTKFAYYFFSPIFFFLQIFVRIAISASHFRFLPERRHVPSIEFEELVS